MASTTYLQQAYLAYFGRPADVFGLSFYASRADSEVIRAFSASPESQAFFGSSDVLTQINTIYQNLFNRSAEPAGLLYWSGEINAGRLSLAQASMGILAGAQNADRTAVTNKLAASAAFTAALDTTPEIIGYQGSAVITPARAFLASVGSDAASLTAATAAARLDATVASVVAAGTAAASSSAGSTFTLTTNSDNFSGTSGNDTFSAPLADNGATNTLLSSDSIDGGQGVDTLNATLNGVTNTLLLSNVQNVEKLNFTINAPAAGAGAIVVNTLGSTNYTDISLVSVNAQAFSVLNLARIPTSVSLQQAVAATDTIDFDAVALAGSTDNFRINLPGSNAGAITISDDGSNPLETITISSTGSANTVTTLTTSSLGATQLVVNGDANLTITSVVDTQATLKTYDASALPSSASLTIGATAMIANATVTGGAGNDSITVSTVAGNDSLNGGAGNDTFTFGATLTMPIRGKVRVVHFALPARSVGTIRLDSSHPAKSARRYRTRRPALT